MPEDRAGTTPGDSPAVWLLAVGQTVAYACLYYVFSALLVAIEADTGWTKAALALGPTLALGMAAMAAPMAGRLVDRGWGGELLIGTPLLGAAGLAVIAAAGGPGGWLGGWAVVGLAQGLGLYDACFAFLIRRLGPQARAAIVRITLVAGFASTITFPAGAWAGEALGWRGAVLAFATVLALCGTAVNLVAVVRLRRGRRAGARAYPDAPGVLMRAMRQRDFWLLGGVFLAIYLAHAMLITFVIPVFQDRGAGHALAVLAASLIGPAQVAGRLVYMGAGVRIGLRRTALSVAGTMALAAGLLWLAGFSVWLIFAFATLQGAAMGITSILRPVMIAEALGQEGFGQISGVLAVAPLAGSALAPVLGALVLDAGGAGGLIGLVFVLALGAAALMAVLRLR